MPTLSTLATFAIASIILLITPGPAVLFIITRSIDQGRLAGIVSVLGVGTGTLFHVAAATLGLSAILLSSALAFSIVKYLGAVYLIYMGVRKFLEKSKHEQPDHIEPKPYRLLYQQGVVVNILNPKLALFFFAFLPQFVDTNNGPVAGQFFVLGMTFAILGICSDSLYALLAGTFGEWLKSSRLFLHGERYLAGTMYIALGLTAAVSGSNHKS
jgi:threonine/homoserine/homoserine lactone efflux protein